MDGVHFSSIRFRLLFLVLMAVVPALGILLYNGSEQGRVAVSEAKENLLRFTRMAASQQRRLIENESWLRPEEAAPLVSSESLLQTILAQLPKGGRFAVIDREGTILFHYPESKKWVGRSMRQAPLIRVLLASREGTAEVAGLDGVPCLAAFSPLEKKPERDLTVAVSIPKERVFSKFNPFFPRSVWGFVFIGLLALLEAWFIGHFLVIRPVNLLEDAVDRIRRGDFSVRTGMAGSPHELSRLARSFDEIPNALRREKEKSQRFSEDLERRVKERTAQLETTNRGLQREIIHRKQVEEALRVANKRYQELSALKDKFVATVSHELRTPLSIIKEGVGLLFDRAVGELNEQQDKLLDISGKNIDRLSRIISDLLDISKLEAGKVTLRMERVDLKDLVRQVAATFQPEVEQKGLELKMGFPSEQMEAYADSDKVIQVLTNLVDDALRFTEKGSIEISAQAKEDFIECAVSDTGIGIAAENLPKVFQKFEQFSRTSDKAAKGTGLGLAIAKELIELQQGTIRVESAPGVGTIFTFTLPRFTAKVLKEQKKVAA
ncbi:MAG: HAMP domain-containing protein [Candidatus Omnitrophica bacterium]|nr:HAMP domain-containing protein [Candidatus Omnitrophota bacterium]